MHKILFYLVLLLALPLFSEPKKTVCLNMIVKNEKRDIGTCLTSLLKIIDYWVIVDTGSTDGTQTIIREILKGLPGELHERPWVNFAHNRNEALQLAKNKGDYILLIDADEKLEFSPGFMLPPLTLDTYNVTVRMAEDKAFDFQRALLINNHLNWKWEGAIHEYLVSPEAKTLGTIENVVNLATSGEGARSQDPKKFEKDIQVLEKALAQDPTNARNVFYLAQSYDKAGNRPLARKNFEKRAAMGGWDQEVFWSLYAIGRLHQFENSPSELIVNSLTKAYHYRPTRAEPLYRLAEHFFETKHYILGYSVAKVGLTLPLPKDLVYVEKWIYDYGLLLQLGNCAAGLDKNEEARTIYQQLLARKDLPDDVRNLVKSNLEICIKRAAKPRS